MTQTSNRARLALVAVILGMTQVAPGAAAGQAGPEIAFTVSMPHPERHLLEVEMRLRAGSAGHTDLVMPAWTPGSYLIRDFARGVQNFSAHDATGGALAWQRTDKNTWRIASGAGSLVVTYAVYANERGADVSEVNDAHAFWNNASVLMYPAGRVGESSELRVTAPGAWDVATSLRPVPGQRHVYRADSFDTLYDSPFEVGTFKTVAFDVRGVRHRVVFTGAGNYDAASVQTDLTKVVDAAISVVGEIPYPDYTFLVSLGPGAAGGGLEHMDSTAIIWDRFGFQPAGAARNFLGLAAHEFFHLWNVKRIRPDTLGPFDYTRENYTRLLWVAEGITSYYGGAGDLVGHLLRRADLISDADYLQGVASEIGSIQSTPGRLETSAEEASFDAWIKPTTAGDDANGPNDRLSYYRKGGMLGLLLDLEIRGRSNGRRSLDDVMRHLYAEFFKKNRNYTSEDFRHACEVMAGASLEDFFKRYVSGREELDYARAFAWVGLKVDDTTDHTVTGVGIYMMDSSSNNPSITDNRLRVRAVVAGTPAYDQGLSAGDEIVALDGVRVTAASYWARLDEKRPGDVINYTIFRGDALKTISFTLGGGVFRSFRIVPLDQPTEAQTKAYELWLGAPFPKK